MAGRQGRRTLKYINEYPAPKEIFDRIVNAKPWPYYDEYGQKYFLMRDRALCAVTYLLAARISEVLRLRTTQFFLEEKLIRVKMIKLSKSQRKGKPRRHQFREEGYLPLTGERAPLSALVLEWLNYKEWDRVNDKVFNLNRTRAWQIINYMLGVPPHWLRAWGENYLYEKWKYDVLAVSDYVKVSPLVLQQYIRQSYKRHRVV